MEAADTNPRITEDQYIPPLLEILEDTGPGKSNEPPRRKVNVPLADSLQALFPEQTYEEKDIQKAKQILGEIATQFTSEQLKDTVTEVQYLVSSWLDDFERHIFNGLTVKEALHEKGATPI